MSEVVRLIGLTGGLLAVMPVLLLITLVVAAERWWLLRRTLSAGSALHGKLRGLGYRNIGAMRELAQTYGRTLQGHLLVTALASRSANADELENHLEEEIMDSMPRLTRGMWILDTAVTIAPLLGLFGTIIGMIQAFDVLSVHGAAGAVTGGIADALVSTGAGLLIAIVAVYFVNYFNSLSARIMHQLELIKVVLVNRFHTRGLTDEADAVEAGAATRKARLARMEA